LRKVVENKKLDIDHVAFIVGDIDKAVKWYETTVDAVIEHKDNDWALLNVYGNKVALTLKDRHPNHVAFRVEKIDHIPGKILDANDVKEHRDGSSYIYMVDPYGNAIELVYYP